MKRIVWFSTLLLCLGAPTHAQDNAVVIGDLIMQEAVGSAMMDAARAETRKSSPAIGAAAGQQGQMTSTFNPSASRRSANLARFVQQSRKVDPQRAAAMERLFRGTDVIAAMGQALAPVGLRTDDVADAYAVWWMSAWQLAHGDASAPDRATAQAVRAQAADALAVTPEFVSADDAAKQELAEAMLVQAALIDGMMEEYGRDPAMDSKVASSVRQGAKAFGLDLDATMLTKAGFVPAKKTGAANPAPGAAREALAASGDRKPGYGLLAVAGGAGLGAAFLIGKAMK